MSLIKQLEMVDRKKNEAAMVPKNNTVSGPFGVKQGEEAVGGAATV